MADDNDKFPGYRLVVFDLDGTITDDTEYVWKTLHSFFGTDGMPERKKARDKFLSGRITYQEWADADIGLMKKEGASRKTMTKALRRIRLVKGIYNTMYALKDMGMKIAVISGGVDLLLGMLVPDHGEIFDRVFINRIIFDDKGNITGCETTPFDIEHKAKGLLKICEKEDIRPEETVFVGDNENDIEIAKMSGLSIAFNPKSEKLEKVCDSVARGDLSLIPDIIKSRLFRKGNSYISSSGK